MANAPSPSEARPVIKEWRNFTTFIWSDGTAYQAPSDQAGIDLLSEIRDDGWRKPVRLP